VTDKLFYSLSIAGFFLFSKKHQDLTFGVKYVSRK